MHYIFYGTDKPNTLELRKQTRQAHLDWVADNKIILAGPRLDENEEMIGSLLVLEAESLDAAIEIFNSDPYAQAGLFASTEISPWKWVIGKPE